MNRQALAGLLTAVMIAGAARAATDAPPKPDNAPSNADEQAAETDVRAKAKILQEKIPDLPKKAGESGDKQLGDQLNELNKSMDKLVKLTPTLETKVRSIRGDISRLQSEVQFGNAYNVFVKQMPDRTDLSAKAKETWKGVAGKLEKITKDAEDLGAPQATADAPFKAETFAGEPTPGSQEALSKGMQAATDRIKARLADAGNPAAFASASEEGSTPNATPLSRGLEGMAEKYRKGEITTAEGLSIAPQTGATRGLEIQNKIATARPSAVVPPIDTGKWDTVPTAELPFSKHLTVADMRKALVGTDESATLSKYDPNNPHQTYKSEADIKEAQRVLKKLGYNVGAIDGKHGPHTDAALAAYKQNVNKSLYGSDYFAADLIPDGKLTSETLGKIREKAYYSGSESDFESTKNPTQLKSMATVYDPHVAKARLEAAEAQMNSAATPAERKQAKKELIKARKDAEMEGSELDKHEQPVCTLEQYLGEVPGKKPCPYVSLAVDPRLNVPNGTPVLIPEISDKLAKQTGGKRILFRITDIGNPKRFKGTGHIDVATETDQNSGYGQLISGGHFTLVLPKGLHPKLQQTPAVADAN